jgi:predicted small lipoprotein YifL
MKRVIVALVLAMSVISVVGCGSGSPTKTTTGTKP